MVFHVSLIRYPKTSAWDIMLGMNLWGTIYNMIYMFGWPRASGFEAVRFCQQYPEAAWDIFLYCCCGAVGQNFIFLTISQFGSLTNTTITTTRKFGSIVVSSVLSGNPLSTKQWGCVFMVFSGLSYQIYLKWQKLQRLQKKRKAMWSPSAILKSNANTIVANLPFTLVILLKSWKVQWTRFRFMQKNICNFNWIDTFWEVQS